MTTSTTVTFGSPNWAPLDRVLPAEQAAMFMWMHTCIHADGLRLEAYKHHVTRQYLILDQNGSAYVPADGDTLQPVPILVALGTIEDRLEQLGWPRRATAADEAARMEQRRERHARHHPRRRRR